MFKVGDKVRVIFTYYNKSKSFLGQYYVESIINNKFIHITKEWPSDGNTGSIEVADVEKCEEKCEYCQYRFRCFTEEYGLL